MNFLSFTVCFDFARYYYINSAKESLMTSDKARDSQTTTNKGATNGYLTVNIK